MTTEPTVHSRRPGFGAGFRAREALRRTPAAVRYGLAALAIGLGIGVHLGLADLASQPPRMGFLYVAVIASAAFLGRGPGYLAIALSVLGHFAVLADPATTGAATVGALIVFSVLSVGIVHILASFDQAQLRSRDAEARWTSLLEQLPDVVFRLDADLRHLQMSPAVRQFTTHEPAAFAGRTPREMGLPAAAADALEAACRETLATGASRVVEYQTGPYAFRTRLVAERDRHGTPRTLLGITEDVTEQKRAEAERERLLCEAERARGEAEAALREASRWDRVFHEAHFGLAYTDVASGRFAAVNPAFARERGWEPQELVGQPFFAVYPDDERERAVEIVRGADVAGHVVFETVHQRRDGSRFPVLVDVTVIKDDAGRAVSRVTHAIDLTVRKRAQEAVRQREEQFRTLANSIPQLAWMARPDGWIFWFNDRWYEYTGTDPEAQVGWGWESVHDPDELPRVLASWRASLASGEPWEAVFPLRRHDGQLLPHLTRAVPLRNAAGEIVLWFGTNTDITAQKLAEERIHHLLREAEERERRRDEFLAMLAHELRNPLAPIRNAAEVIRLLAADDPRLATAGQLVERQVTHMTRLVDDLLDVSRITRGAIVLRRAPVSLATIVRDAVEAARPVVDEHRHELRADGVPDDAWIDGDHARLVQVFANLLTNAAKFTPPGGRITLTCRRRGGEVDVGVRDTGVGIPPEIQDRIFDLFTQGDPGLARARGGLGIGLTLVQRLVELHGGRIAVASGGTGQGAEFTVTLPTTRAPATPALRLGARTGGASRALRVLVVEDNRDAAESFRVLLELDGHEVRVAESGDRALGSLAEAIPDVAFLDIGLPGMDGFEVARRLRADPRTRNALLIAVTGYGRDEDKARARAAGFDVHMTKPVDLDAVRAALARRAGAVAGAAPSRSPAPGAA